jgi:hypothetical protein
VREVAEPAQAKSQPAADRSRWWAADLRNDHSWIRQFTAAELSELHVAAASLHERGLEPPNICKTRFPLPILEQTISSIRDELESGRGITLLRGLNVDDYDFDHLKRLCFGLGAHLGTIAHQNLDGDFLRRVTDMSSAGPHTDALQARGHRGRTEMLPHSDSADVVGLLCVRPAKQGGGTTVCSAAAIYAELARTSADYLNALCAGFFFDMTGKTVRGFSNDRLPVFARRRARLSCQFNRSRIEVGMQKAGAPLDQLEIAALDYMTELAQRPDIAFRLDLRAGDLLLLNNHITLHARDEYEDWPEANRKRLLLRLWVNFLSNLAQVPIS